MYRVIGVSLNQVVCVCLDVRIKTLCSIVVKYLVVSVCSQKKKTIMWITVRLSLTQVN